MKCSRCAAPLTSRRISRPYAEAGLANVLLLNVVERVCRRCRSRELVLPHVETLHRRIAHAIVLQPAALTPPAIRFLRTWLGWTCRQLADMMGVRRETAFRWEREDASYHMTRGADRLLRMLVTNREPVGCNPLELFSPVPAAPEPFQIALRAPEWD